MIGTSTRATVRRPHSAGGPLGVLAIDTPRASFVATSLLTFAPLWRRSLRLSSSARHRKRTRRQPSPFERPAGPEWNGNGNGNGRVWRTPNRQTVEANFTTGSDTPCSKLVDSIS